jgi:hypothetical protein
MLEKIGRYAETLATRAGQSRRGFLGLTGKGALSLASLVGGLLLSQGEAVAGVCTGSCLYRCPDGTVHATNCSSSCSCDDTTIKHSGMTCSLIRSTCELAHDEGAEPRARSIRIEVWDGIVQSVSNVPPGWDYEILDYDHGTIWRGSEG